MQKAPPIVNSRPTRPVFRSAAITALLFFLTCAPPWGWLGAAPTCAQESALLSLPSPVGPVQYEPGRSLRLGNTGFAIGGYSALNFSRNEGEVARLNLDDLSFFVIGDPVSHLHLFSELEFEDLVNVDHQGGGGTSDADFVLERLYGDLEASDSVNLRVGKFLTPVGRWNVIHAQPLVWTTSRPLATEVAFDRHTTGATLFGSVYPRGGTLTYSLFGQFVDALEPSREVLPAGRSAGGRLEYSVPSGLSVAATYLASSHHGDWQHLGGLDALWQRGPLELMSEWVFAKGTGDLGDAWGGYVQSALEVLPSFYLVDRYEHFDQRAPEPEVNLVVLGAAYKPLPHVIVKAEYLIADHPASESPPGFKASLAFLF